MAASTLERSETLASPRGSGSSSPVIALVRRSFLDARIRTVVCVYIFAVYSWLQAAGYRSAFPTIGDRRAFAVAFAGNDAIRLFYGYPYNVVTIGGYSAWRVGGTLALAAAAFGVLAAVSALRAEEDAGRAELVVAGVVSRTAAFSSSMFAVALSSALLWLAELTGYLIAGLPVAGSAFLALATASVVPVFVGIGAVASQLAPNRRMAIAIGAGVAVVFWLLRVLSDTFNSAAWIRWATPLGWAELLRPFSGPQPAILLLPLAATVVLVWVAARISRFRDLGEGVLSGHDRARASGGLLSSPTKQALLNQRYVLVAWAVGVAAIALVLGTISTSISGAGLSANLRREFAKFGAGPITTPTGYLSFVFVIFVFAMCLFACWQIGTARQEEADQRLETLLAEPVSRYRWLAGRVVLATTEISLLSVLAAVFIWTGAASQGLRISLPQMMQAGANCLPVSILVLGCSAFVYSLLPRASSAISYTLVTAMFLWYLVGSILDVPKWAVGLTPFQHIGLVPSENFRVEAAVVMLAVGAAAVSVAMVLLRRRDLLGN
jgi:ABC-2 type transport system permease protein